MRYLGNKDALLDNINELLRDKGLWRIGFTFLDAFCGMGSVSDSLKDRYHLIINDILKCCTTYTAGLLYSNSIELSDFPCDPFLLFNNLELAKNGFMYKNYTPGGSERMYFSSENGARIDAIREKIESWKTAGLIDDSDYFYLLACLLEGVSSISNTAGVYGAFLKHWDSRALHPLAINPLKSRTSSLLSKPTVYNDRIEDIISNIECDILYLDPPYTQNQYGTQYHLLETLIRCDNPPLSKITGSRPVTPLKSNWSRDKLSHIAFEKVIAETKARYIILSYNNDGFMSKDFIEATMKRYGIPDTYECREISYKQYQNFKSHKDASHKEYLFFVEKCDKEQVVIESPLNYTGSKSKEISFIKQNLPANIKVFADVFGGGFNVGININAEKIVYNDINNFVVDLIRSFRTNDTYPYLQYINKLIKQYNLAVGEREPYNNLREKFNSIPKEKRDPRMLYTLILYGFQQQIRFNGSHDFNNPIGSRYFNEQLLSKFLSFSRVIKERNVEFENMSFENFVQKYNSNDVFFYLDPPYLYTTGAYNDGKRGYQGWTKEHENNLISVIDDINDSHRLFMLSYVVKHSGIENRNILEWVARKGYKLIEVDKAQGRYNDRNEVLIVNY